MLPLFAYLVLALVSAQHVELSALWCESDRLTRARPYNETFRVQINQAANREWLRMELSVLVTNRTDYSKPGYAPPHTILLTMPSVWAARLDDPVQTADGTLTLLRVSRDEAEQTDAQFDIHVFIHTDATGCFNVSGLGIMTQVRFLGSDAFSLRHREMATAMCTHEQPSACVSYYKPLSKVRDVCKLCYLSFIVFAFALVFLLWR